MCMSLRITVFRLIVRLKTACIMKTANVRQIASEYVVEKGAIVLRILRARLLSVDERECKGVARAIPFLLSCNCVFVKKNV